LEELKRELPRVLCDQLAVLNAEHPQPAIPPFSPFPLPVCTPLDIRFSLIWNIPGPKEDLPSDFSLICYCDSQRNLFPPTIGAVKLRSTAKIFLFCDAPSLALSERILSLILTVPLSRLILRLRDTSLCFSPGTFYDRSVAVLLGGPFFW